MKNKKYIYSIIVVLILAILGFTAIQKNSVQANSRIKIVFWHEMTGLGQTQLNEFVKEFNSSQNKYVVVPQFEGNYNEAVQKF